MLDKNDISKLLEKMTDNVHSNLKKLKKAFGSLEYRDCDNQSLLHILVDNKYDEGKCFLAIKSLLKKGLSPNLKADFNYNFIQTALYAGYSEEFIINIIKESLKYNLYINHIDSDKDTIMHTAIYSDDYLGEVYNIYELLCDNGFDSSKIDGEGRNLIEAMIYQKQYSTEQIGRMNYAFKKRTGCVVEEDFGITSLSDSEIVELERYGKVLNLKNDLVTPTVGRDKELKDLMFILAQDKINPIIVGEAGVGKTALINELIFRIKTGQVPKFLQGKIILGVDPLDICSDCQDIGTIEENMLEMMRICEKNDVIVFFDQIHAIYGVSDTKKDENYIAEMLKHYIDSYNLKVIGTTTESEYNAYFSYDILKKRFEKVNVMEPTRDILYQIINKTIDDYCLKCDVSFENENVKEKIVDIVVSATEKSYRVANNVVNNPALAISIIDKVFACVKVYDSEFITADHFIESFEYCDKICESAREEAITKLKNLDNDIAKPTPKVLKINFKKFRK